MIRRKLLDCHTARLFQCLRPVHGRVFVIVPVAIAIASAPGSAWSAEGDPAKQFERVTGILFDKANDWFTVKADGDKEPVKYQVDPNDKKLAESYKTVFNACRVLLTYKTDGDSRRLVSIRRQILKDNGMVTGDVVKVHNNFWVEVKPKNGVADAYAPGANYNDKAFMEKLKGLKELKEGDSVTITFTTDFERHRIKSLKINTPRPAKADDPAPPATPPRK